MNKWIKWLGAGGMTAVLLTGCLGGKQEAADPVPPNTAKAPSVSPPAQAPEGNRPQGEAAAAPVKEPVKVTSDTAKPAVPEPKTGEPVTPAKPAEQKSDTASTKNTNETKSVPAQAPAPAETPASGANAPAKQEDVDGVVDRYKKQLLALKEVYLADLKKLSDKAMAARNSGKTEKEVLEQFSQQALPLQEDSQAKVNQILFQLKNELTERNMPTDSVNELRAAYYAEVDKAKQQVTEQLNVKK